MSNLSVTEFRSKAMELYRSGAHAEALSFVESEMHRFPDQHDVLYYFRIITAALSGRTDHALAVIEEALDRGLWVPERDLRNPQLKALHDLPEFEDLVTRCKARHEEAMAEAKPYRETLAAAESQAGAAPLLVGMHGNAGNVDQGRAFWTPATELGWQVALLQSSQVYWPGRYLWDDMEKGSREVVQHVSELEGFDPDRVVLSGFSAGGRLSMRLAMSGEVKARGFVAIGPWLPSVEELKPYIATAKELGIRGWIQVNDDDQVCRQCAEDAYKLLHEAGIPCVFDLHQSGGHTYPAQFDLTKALNFVLGE